MRRFSKVSIVLSHEGNEESEFSVPSVEMTNGSASVQVSDLESALGILSPGSEVTVVATGTVGNKTVHTISRIIREGCVLVALDLSAVTELSRVFDSPFQGNKNLFAMQFPNNLVSINPRAFADCTNLVSVSIPATVKKIGVQAFAGCEKLTALEFADPHQWMSCVDEQSPVDVPDLDNPEDNAFKFSMRSGAYYNTVLQKSALKEA